jgi:hypothetical protein
MQTHEVPLILRVWVAVKHLDLPSMLVGGLAAALRHRWGAYVLAANLVVQIGFHQVIGAWAYRDVMSRPWPKVSPSTDEDWDD